MAVLALLPLGALGVELWAFAAARPGGIAWVEAVGGPLCHHDPARTLTLGGELLPVCARCTGMYLSAGVAGAVGLVLGGSRARVRALLRLGLGATAVGLGFALAELAGLVGTPNAARLVLGGLLGTAPTLILGLGGRVLLDEGRGGPAPRASDSV